VPARDLFEVRTNKSILFYYPAKIANAASRRSRSKQPAREDGPSAKAAPAGDNHPAVADNWAKPMAAAELIDLARRGVARDLHDHAGQSLVGISMRLAALENSVADEKIRASLSDLRSMVCDFSEELRAICHGETPGLHPEDFTVSVARLVGEWEKMVQIPIKLELNETGSTRLKGPVTEVIFRVVQESLTNVAKHAPQSSLVKVGIRFDAAHIRVEIEDDGGKKPPPPQAANRQRYRDGISGMRERVTQVGGELRIDHISDSGTRVLALLPREGSMQASEGRVAQ